MPLAQALSDFRACVAQCDNLIVSAHRVDVAGASLFGSLEQQQISVAAFLNMFIGWESFLESTFLHLMIGHPTVGGTLPVRRVGPLTIEDARKMIRGAGRAYFDYTRHDYVQATARMYFDNGYPYEPHISSIMQELSEIKTIRNSCAHTGTATQISLEGLAFTIAGQPVHNVTVYRVLTMSDPRSGSSGTVLETYKNKLLIAAGLIAQG